MAIELESFHTLLYPEDLKRLESAKALIDRAIPDSSAVSVVASYIRENVTKQEEVSHLKAQVDTTIFRKKVELFRVGAGEREALMSEGYRSAAERDEMIYRESYIRDKAIDIQQLESLSNYLNGLEWRLKSLLKAVES